MFKTVQVVAHTTGGEVSSAPEQMVEREYETLKETLKDITYLEFNTENGWALIPASQLLYIEVKAY